MSAYDVAWASPLGAVFGGVIVVVAWCLVVLQVVLIWRVCLRRQRPFAEEGIETAPVTATDAEDAAEPGRAQRISVPSCSCRQSVLEPTRPFVAAIHPDGSADMALELTKD